MLTLFNESGSFIITKLVNSKLWFFYSMTHIIKNRDICCKVGNKRF